MNLSPRWVEWFAEAGIPAIHWATVGRVDATDTDIMQYAADHDYVVMTQDLDFGSILAATQRKKPSVVQVRAGNLTPEVIGDRVVASLRQVEVELGQGALLTIDPSRRRLTILPLGLQDPTGSAD
jgi:predicted nuclease of predicted toxin-antitoxin system